MVLDPSSGLDAFWSAKPEVRELILAHAQRRVESTMTALTSLTQRVSSVCGLLFAGAAVSANLSIDPKHSDVVHLLGAVAATAFVVGGSVGLIGLVSGRTEWPGEKPSWWCERGADQLRTLDKDGAGYWVAGHYEMVITAIARVNKQRAAFLHTSLFFGAVGGICLAAAAWVPVPKDQAAPNVNPCIQIQFAR